MLTTKAWLFITLGGFGGFYIITWVAARSWERSSEPIAPTPLLGAIPAVLIAALIVKSLDLYYVRWLVVAVVVYTALSMLRSAASERQSLRKSAQPPALEDVVICPTKAP